MKKTLVALTAVALLAAMPAGAQVNFSRYVALGDSLTAGYASGGLVAHHQYGSYPALLARQAGVPTGIQQHGFQLPIVSEPGFPPLIQLLSLQGPVIGVPPGAHPGTPLNATYPAPYNDLGVPGFTLYDMLTKTGDIMNLLAGNTDNAMADLILRTPQVPGPTGDLIDFSAITQAVALDPTFVTLWIGNNDILSAATAATPIEGVTMTPVDIFASLYQQAVATLVQATSADIVLINLPNATAIPFVTTVTPFVTIPGIGVIQLQGSNGPVSADSYVTLLASSLIAQGYGLPIPGSPPLPDDLTINPTTGAVTPGVILRPDEVATINGRIAAFNHIIADTAATFGLPVLDINSRFDAIAGGDLWVLGGLDISADFLLGGIFSYDGVHPQNIGYALVVTELVDLINDYWGASIEQPDMSAILCGEVGCAGGGTPTVITPSLKNAIFSPDLADRLMAVFPPRLPERAPEHGVTAVD